MKKIMAISAIVAFTVAGFAEARGGRSGGFGGSSSRAVVSKPTSGKWEPYGKLCNRCSCRVFIKQCACA